MRAVVQRVLSASVSVDGEVISQISRGLMVLVGIGIDDTAADIDILTKKLLHIRVFDDDSGSMWKRSVGDIHGEILCVSQFTLMANTSKGKKPDFHNAMGSENSRAFYSSFLDKLAQFYPADRIKDGKFGAIMNVSLMNEGPVTLTLDTRKFEYTKSTDSKAAPAANSFSPLNPQIAADGTKGYESDSRAKLDEVIHE